MNIFVASESAGASDYSLLSSRQHSTAPPPQGPGCTFGLQAIGLVRDCVAETLSAKYRESAFSRRSFWHVSLPILSGYNLVSDFCVGTDPPILLVDLALFVGEVLVTCRLPPQSWWCDAIMVAAVEGAFACLSVLSEEGQHYAQTTPSVNTFCTLFFLHLCGVNTFAVFVGILLNLFATALVSPGELVMIAISSLTLLPWTLLADSGAVMAQRAHGAVLKLLDDCNDGFFSMNLGTGQMRGISDKMKELFDIPPDCSQPFAEFVATDDFARFERLLAEARRGNLEATVLSCRTASQVFDCKLIPYFTCLNQLSMCLQMIGEARMVAPPCPEGLQARGGSSQDPFTRIEEECLEDGGMMTLGVPGRGGPGGPEDDGNGTEITFDLGSIAPPASGTLSYSATQVTDPRRQRSDACTQTLSAESVSVAAQTTAQATRHPPTQLPSSVREPTEGGAHAAKKQPPARSRKTKRHVQLCSSRRCIPEFAATPETFISMQLTDLLPRINATGSGCCKFHITLARLQLVLRAMYDGRCQRDFRPYCDWQCGKCYAMNLQDDVGEDGEVMCGLCSAEEPLLPGTPAGESGCDGGTSASGASSESRPASARSSE